MGAFWSKEAAILLYGGGLRCVIVRVIFLMPCRRVTETCCVLGELQMKLKIRLFVTVSHHLRKNERHLAACAVTCTPLVAFSSCLRIFQNCSFCAFSKARGIALRWADALRSLSRTLRRSVFCILPLFSKLLARGICENRAAFHAPATEYGWLAHRCAAFCISNAPAQSPPPLFIKPPPMPIPQADCLLFFPRVKGVLRF